MTESDKIAIECGVTALRRVGMIIREGTQIVDPIRAPLVLRDIEGLANRLDEPAESDWDLGKNFAFLSPQDIGVVSDALELLRRNDPKDRENLRQSLRTLETFLRRFLECWS
jgi:hypothetical protein